MCVYCKWILSVCQNLTTIRKSKLCKPVNDVFDVIMDTTLSPSLISLDMKGHLKSNLYIQKQYVHKNKHVHL